MKKVTYLFVFILFFVVGLCIYSTSYRYEHYSASINHERHWKESIILKQFGPLREILKYFDLNNYSGPKSSIRIKTNFTKADIDFNDSILGLARNLGFFDDKWKKWRPTEIEYKSHKHKLEYKIHGGDFGWPEKGLQSYKFRSEQEIDGRKQIVCLNKVEFGFHNLFYNYMQKINSLISPEIGEIVLADLGGGKNIYLLTEDISESYLIKNYGFDEVHIYKTHDYWDHLGEGHFSELDRFFFYLADENKFKDTSDHYILGRLKLFYEGYQEDTSFWKTQNSKYLGRFLANMYFNGHPHHVFGDNHKWIWSRKDSTFYPIARNEGFYKPLASFDLGEDKQEWLFDLVYFNEYGLEKGKSLEFYKRAMSNPTIKRMRDHEFARILLEKERIFSILDSLYTHTKPAYRGINRNFELFEEYTVLKQVVQDNFKYLDKYLNGAEVAVAVNLDSNTIEVVTDSRLTLSMQNAEESIMINPVGLDYADGALINKTIEIQKFSTTWDLETLNLNFVVVATGHSINPSKVRVNYYRQ